MQYQCNCGVYYDPASYDKGDLYYLFYSCPTCREKKRITEKSKYVLFCFSDYYPPGGGANDIVGFYETVEDARRNRQDDNYQIVELKTFKIIEFGRPQETKMRIGKVERKILDYLDAHPRENISPSALGHKFGRFVRGIYDRTGHTNFAQISQILNRLEGKGLIHIENRGKTSAQVIRTNTKERLK